MTARASNQLGDLAVKAVAALQEASWGPRGIYRTATVSTVIESGQTVTCTKNESKDCYGQSKVVTQFKVDGKVTSWATVDLLMGGRRAERGINEALRVAFEAQAPTIIQNYVDYIKASYEEQVTKRGPALALSNIWDDDRFFLKESIHPVCDATLDATKPHRNVVSAWTLNADKLLKVATAFGYAAALDWFNKTNSKLGALELPNLLVSRGGFVEITGTRAGKAIRMSQQQVLKRSKLGRLFYQYPARIYIDEKFTPEREYIKQFDLPKANVVHEASVVEEHSDSP